MAVALSVGCEEEPPPPPPPAEGEVPAGTPPYAQPGYRESTDPGNAAPANDSNERRRSGGG